MTTFFEERQKHNPRRLITFLEFDTGSSQATLNGFERPWRVVVTGLGVAAATVVSTPRLDGNKALRVQVRTGDSLSMVATTLATPVDLSALETIRLFVRSDKTGLPMRLGLGEASAGEFLPDLAAVATTNAYVEREVTITSLPVASRNAIAKLRLEIYGAPGAGKGTALLYFDKMFAVKRNRYANMFQARPGVALPGDPVDLDISGTAEIVTDGHAMDNGTSMDGSSPMADGVTFSAGGASTDAVDLSQQNTLQTQFTVNAAPATLRFGFGEATSSERTFDFSIITAGSPQTKIFDISSIATSARNAVRFWTVIPLAIPTSNPDFTASLDSLISQRYYTPSPILPYRVFLEKLKHVTPITQSLAPIQSRMQMAHTRLTLANHDGEFYRLRDTTPMLNRNVRLFSGFENFHEQEMQTMFLGTIRDETLSDETYEVGVEDAMSRLFHDLPVNVTQLPSGPHTTTFSRPIPVVFGRPRKIFPAPIVLYNQGASAVGATSYLVGRTIWYINDPVYGNSGGVSALYYRGVAIPSITTYLQGVWGIGYQATSLGTYRNWGWDPSTQRLLTWGVPTRPELITIDMSGYKDDADGTYTGTPNAVIQNPADVYRFAMLKILGMDPAMIDFSALDTARTLMQGYKVARAIRDRQNSLQIFGGGPQRDGLAQNMLLYFFQSNVSGKMLVLNAQTPTSIATSGSYFATGKHSNIVKNTYRKRAQPERVITRIEIDYNYSMASGRFADNLQIVDPSSENLSRSNKTDIYKILGKWIPGDVTGLHISYIGTAAGGATLTILGEGTANTYQLRITSGNASESFTVDLEGASGRTMSWLKTTIDNKAKFVATLNPSIISSMDARSLRDVKAMSLATAKHVKFSWAKAVAVKYLDEYATNRDLIEWRSPWVAYLQELGLFAAIRSLGESTTRTVRIMQTMRDPLNGGMTLRGEEV
jgi:hypothetical protein